MLNSKKANLVLAFILAVALWFFVVGQMNPETKKTYRNVPVTLLNEQTLSDSGLAVRRVSAENMRVTVKGKRDVVSSLTKTDIVASVDLANAAEGQNKLQINIKIPENIEIDNQSLDDITVSVEDLVVENKNVSVTYDGDPEEGYEPYTVKLDPGIVQVSGAKSLIDKVSSIKATVPIEDVAETLTTVNSQLYAVSRSGGVIDATLQTATCKVTCVLYKTKEVKLKVKTYGSQDDVKISAPKKVTIKGEESSIEKIKSIETKGVALSSLKAGNEVKLEPELPDGVVMAEKDKEIKGKVRKK